MNIGIVGHEAAKFTPGLEAKAKAIIAQIIDDAITIAAITGTDYPTIVSGHCHLGGIDIWTEEYAIANGQEMKIFAPAKLNWDQGYKPRNIQIARASDIVHNMVLSLRWALW